MCTAVGTIGTVVEGSHSWLLADPGPFVEVIANDLQVAQRARQMEAGGDIGRRRNRSFAPSSSAAPAAPGSTSSTPSTLPAQAESGVEGGAVNFDGRRRGPAIRRSAAAAGHTPGVDSLTNGDALLRVMPTASRSSATVNPSGTRPRARRRPGTQPRWRSRPGARRRAPPPGRAAPAPQLGPIDAGRGGGAVPAA